MRKIDSSLLLAATIIVVTMIAAATVLILYGHSEDVFRGATLIGQGVSALLILWGVNSRARRSDQKIPDAVEERLNGSLANAVREVLDGQERVAEAHNAGRKA